MAGHFPAVDVLASVSRVMTDVVTPDHRTLARRVREVLSAYKDAADLVEVGAYVSGTNPRVDAALRCISEVNAFLCQEPGERFALAETLNRLRKANQPMASRLQLYPSRRNVVPSLAIPLWLIFIAAAQPDPLSPPPHGRDAGAPVQPIKPAAPSAKAPPSVAKPTDPKSPKSPSVPVAAKPTSPAPQPPKTAGKTAKVPPRLDTAPADVEEPEEEIVADPSGKAQAHKKGPRKVATVDRAEVPEHKSPWSADRYAAVVPPGLTLAALRSQLSKGATPVVDSNAPASEHAARCRRCLTSRRHASLCDRKPRDLRHCSRRPGIAAAVAEAWPRESRMLPTAPIPPRLCARPRANRSIPCRRR
jgi:hypothetical protein